MYYIIILLLIVRAFGTNNQVGLPGSGTVANPGGGGNSIQIPSQQPVIQNAHQPGTHQSPPNPSIPRSPAAPNGQAPNPGQPQPPPRSSDSLPMGELRIREASKLILKHSFKNFQYF